MDELLSKGVAKEFTRTSCGWSGSPLGESVALPVVRCFSCGSEIASTSETVRLMMSSGMTIANAMDVCGVGRFCCRARIMTPHRLPTSMNGRAYGSRCYGISDLGAKATPRFISLTKFFPHRRLQASWSSVLKAASPTAGTPSKGKQTRFGKTTRDVAAEHMLSMRKRAGDAAFSPEEARRRVAAMTPQQVQYVASVAVERKEAIEHTQQFLKCENANLKDVSFTAWHSVWRKWLAKYQRDKRWKQQSFFEAARARSLGIERQSSQYVDPKWTGQTHTLPSLSIERFDWSES